MNFFTKSAVAAAALASASLVQAVVVNFEGTIDTTFAPNAPLMGHNDEILNNGYWIDPLSNVTGALDGDFVGALVNGSDLAATCVGITCPSNNSSTFYAALNDGYVAIGAVNAAPFYVRGLDAAFIGASGDVLPTVPGLVRIQGVKTDNTSITQTFSLTGPGAGGALSFASYSTSGSFAATQFKYIFIYGFVCNSAGSCSAFTSDKGQFAIDNLNVDVNAPVPEPSAWALMALGLTGVAAAARRRTV
jgi:hypothetical protein